MARVNGTLTGTTKGATDPPLAAPPRLPEPRSGNPGYTDIPFLGSRTTLYGPTVAYGLNDTSQQVINVGGTYTWICPTGITTIYVEAWGGGGAGAGDTTANAGSAAGGGGAFAVRTSLAVTPGTSYTFVVGAGGIFANLTKRDGSDSSFVGDSQSVIAKAGQGGIGTGSSFGAGGSAAASTGDTTHSGGNGGAGAGGTTTGGAGGGAAAGRSLDGAAGTSSVGGSGTGRVGGTGADGGGSGGHGNSSSNSGLTAGSSPGGGGGGGGGSGSANHGSSGADGEVTISCGVVCPYINTATQVYALTLATIPMPFKASTTVVYALAVQGYVTPSFIASTTTLYTPSLQGYVSVPFISSVTAVYTPTLEGPLNVPFIASTTVVYTPTLILYLNVPFILSHTHVWDIMSLFDPNKLYAGQGNGGEGFLIRLNANGVTDTATLASNIGTGTGAILNLTGDGAFPTTHPFIVTIDSEQLYVSQISPGHYLVRARARGNTTAASHTAGATVSWGDSYDQALTATEDINHNFSANINGSGTTTYPGWLICFDSSQAYLDDGSRYPMHVTQVMGVFAAGAGVSGTNKTDGAQPNAITTTTATSDDCPAALSNPARIATDIVTGDVAVLRYTNPESTVLDLGPRSACLQSWYGIKRVSTSDADVTFTDPNGISVDTTGTYDTFTGSVNGEWDPAPLLTGIAPAASDAAGHAVDTPNVVPWTTVTLPGTDRFFTRGSGSGGYNENGWPMCCLAVRQGRKRVPFWQSWDWHDFSYVYSGFAVDATYAQILINRNGVLFESVPAVELPGPQDIDGPDAVWDDADYAYGASWYVVIFNTPYLVAGPPIGGTHTIPPGGDVIPRVHWPSGGGGPPSVGGGSPGEPPVEGGSGGNIGGSEGLHVWQTS